LNLNQGSFTMRIELMGGTRTRLDCIYFDELPGSGVESEADTWGRLKAMWR
jgi:hypothetical protein